jgi:hypothetical protein
VKPGSLYFAGNIKAHRAAEMEGGLSVSIAVILKLKVKKKSPKNNLLTNGAITLLSMCVWFIHLFFWRLRGSG